MNLNVFKNPSTRAWTSIGAGIVVIIAVAIGCMSQKDTMQPNSYVTNPYTTWRQYGGGADQSKYVELTQITKGNIKNLELAWTYPTQDNVGAYRFNPLIVDNVMYLLAKNNSIVAVDATTGKEIWVHSGLNTGSKKGLNYWESKDRKDRRIIFTMNNTLQEVDATTGKSILTFGTNGAVNLREGLGRPAEQVARATSSSPGAIFDDLIILGMSPGEATFATPGHLRAYNIITGKMEWIFHTVPHPGEYGYETWPKDAYKYVGGANTWGEISIDAKRGIAYFPIGSPTYDYYGADRKGQNLYGNCLLALDARTGKRLWHYQLVHHDIWDFDVVPAPQLVTVNHNGKKIDAVAQATKHGFMFAFNRVTGEPLWPIEERPVPKSNVPGEESWPTQPFPTVLPPFSRQKVTFEDINPYFTAEQKETWKKRMATAKSGLFEPLSDQYETITMPGANGGAITGNTASNPMKGLVFVSTQDKPSVYILKKAEPAELRIPLSANETEAAKALYAQNCQSCHGANYEGGVGPSLANISNRVTFDNFKTTVSVGRAQMPAFLHLGDQNVTAIYKLLAGPAGGQRPGGAAGRGGPPGGQAAGPVTGPVVATGGAPGAEEFRMIVNKPMTAYPDGVTPPKDRYVDGSSPSYGLGFPNLVGPPWSSVVCYDLNTGKIKWKRPLGNDEKVAPGKELGIPAGSQHKGMVVTSTGIIFATSADGYIYAYDEDNGNLLWKYKFPRVSEGVPAMYQANGRQYLVVCAVNEKVTEGTANNITPRAYYVFALPKKK
jgi:quinoprotein glucose dehydrogenase